MVVMAVWASPNHSAQMFLQEPEREVHRMRAKADQLASQQSTLEITLCDLSKVAMLWTCKLADIREAHNCITFFLFA